MSAGGHRRLAVELPDGTVAGRTTAHDYTHVVAVQDSAGAWDVVLWSHAEQTAVDRANEERGKWWGKPSGRTTARSYRLNPAAYEARTRAWLGEKYGRPVYAAVVVLPVGGAR